MQSPFWFCLNSPEPRAVIEFTKRWCKWDCRDLRFLLKCSALQPRCAKCYKGVCDNQTRDEHDLDDDDDNNEWQWQYILRLFLWLFSSLQSYHIFVSQTACWLYCSFINMKEKVAIFLKQSWLCVCMLHAAVLSYMIICQKRCSASYKVWQCVNWKYFSNSY